MLRLPLSRLPVPVATIAASVILLVYAMANNLYGGPVLATSLAAVACILLTARVVARPTRCHWRAVTSVGWAIALAPLALLPFVGFPPVGFLVHFLCGAGLVLRAAREPHAGAS
jgi:predicted membrane metal-binding protein